MRVAVDQIAARRGDLGHDIITGFQTLNKRRTVLAGDDILLDHIAIGLFDLEHRVLQRLARLRVYLLDQQAGESGVLNRQLGVLGRRVLDLQHLIIQDVLFQGLGFLHLVSACGRVFDLNAAIFIRGVIAQQYAVPPDFELYACQRLFCLAVYLLHNEGFLLDVIQRQHKVAVCGVLALQHLCTQFIPRKGVTLHKLICAGVCIVNGERAVRSGREHADAPAILEALKYNALHGLSRIKVDLLYDNILFAGIGDGEESGVFTVVLDGKRRFIEDIARVCHDLLCLICPRLCIGQPDAAMLVRGVVAQQPAVLPDLKGNALDRLPCFLVDLVDTEVLLDGILENQRGDLGLISGKFDGLFRRVQVVMLLITVHLYYTVGAGLEVLDHRFAVLTRGNGGELGVVVVYVKLPALQGDPGVLVLLDDTDGQLLRVRDIDLTDDLRRVCGGVYVDLVFHFVLQVALRRLDLDHLIKALGEVVHLGIAVHVCLDGLQHLAVPADLKGSAGQRLLAVLVILVNFDAGQRGILERQGNIAGIVPAEGLDIRTVCCIPLRRCDLIHLKRAGGQVPALDGEPAQRVRYVGIDKIVIYALDLKLCAHQVPAVRAGGFMHLENVVVTVGQCHFNSFAASGASVYHFIRQQGIALWRFGFLDRDINIKRKSIKYRFTITICCSLTRFFNACVSDLKRATLQWSTILISF
ncbi:Uncharacterised protein [uncultured Butyricicoccus sp.]|nr:Uncharacterised protein [uncultured Butyricicoccus sp.]